MERSSPFTTPEIVGIATATAAALGGVIVALGRSQSSSNDSRLAIMPNPVTTFSKSDAVGARDRGHKAMNVASALISEMYPGLRNSASDVVHRAAVTTRPQVSRAAELASARAERARSTSSSLVERLQDVVVPAAVAAISSVAEQAGEAKHRAQPVASDAAAMTAAKAEVAVDKTTSAAKESFALIIWSAIAAILVYKVILDEERREKFREFLFGALEQGRLLVQDFQGYEEDV
jgi:hypothetical protein